MWLLEVVIALNGFTEWLLKIQRRLGKFLVNKIICCTRARTWVQTPQYSLKKLDMTSLGFSVTGRRQRILRAHWTVSLTKLERFRFSVGGATVSKKYLGARIHMHPPLSVLVKWKQVLLWWLSIESTSEVLFEHHCQCLESFGWVHTLLWSQL